MYVWSRYKENSIHEASDSTDWDKYNQSKPGTSTTNPICKGEVNRMNSLKEKCHKNRDQQIARPIRDSGVIWLIDFPMQIRLDDSFVFLSSKIW